MYERKSMTTTLGRSHHSRFVSPAALTATALLAPANTLQAMPAVVRKALPLSDQMGFLREAVGGELITGARYLLSGTPGGGKSRLATQVCLDLAVQGVRSLTILTEEAPAQLKRRALQMTADWTNRQVQQAMAAMQVDGGVLDVGMLPDFLVRQVLSKTGVYHGVQLVVLDSIQGHGLAASATKAYGKVLEFAQLCEANGITALMLAHQTKRGDIAGPKTLEHSIDTSLVLRRAMLYSLLAVRKNRYGPPLLKPLPLRINPISTRVEPAPHCESRPAMARTFAGAGTGLLELQAAVTVPVDGSKGRMTAPGLPRREIEQLITCIAGMHDMDFGELDFSVHCRLPGAGQYQPHLGLPLCMSLIGSYLRQAIPTNHLYIGEIDLFRAVRPVAPGLMQDLRATLDAGDIPLPVTLFVPATSVSAFSGTCEHVQIVACKSLEDAVFQTWPGLR
jgi:DNA repair protein RadA/Sms